MGVDRPVGIRMQRPPLAWVPLSAAPPLLLTVRIAFGALAGFSSSSTRTVRCAIWVMASCNSACVLVKAV